MFKVGWTTLVNLPQVYLWFVLVRVTRFLAGILQHVVLLKASRTCVQSLVCEGTIRVGQAEQPHANCLQQHGNRKSFYQPRSCYQSPRAGLLADMELTQQEEALWLPRGKQKSVMNVCTIILR